jgi:hypothetical protein
LVGWDGPRGEVQAVGEHVDEPDRLRAGGRLIVEKADCGERAQDVVDGDVGADQLGR